MNSDLSNLLFISKPKPLTFSSLARKAIPTQAVMISCCNETQTSADVQNVGEQIITVQYAGCFCSLQFVVFDLYDMAP